MGVTELKVVRAVALAAVFLSGALMASGYVWGLALLVVAFPASVWSGIQLGRRGHGH